MLNVTFDILGGGGGSDSDPYVYTARGKGSGGLILSHLSAADVILCSACSITCLLFPRACNI